MCKKREYVLDYGFLPEISRCIMDNKSGLFYIHGHYGVGKTHLLYQSIKALVEAQSEFIVIDKQNLSRSIIDGAVYSIDDFSILYNSIDKDELIDFLTKIKEKGLVLIICNQKDITEFDVFEMVNFNEIHIIRILR